MDSIIQGKVTKENRPIKRFGYIISVVFIVVSNIGLVFNCWFTGWLYLLTIYFLTASLWVPTLIYPLYWLYRRLLRK